MDNLAYLLMLITRPTCTYNKARITKPPAPLASIEKKSRYRFVSKTKSSYFTD